MPKDAKKNRYFSIGIGWDSWTLAQLEADAKLHQMDDQPAKLIVLRLTEYYSLVEKGIITPGVTAMMQPAQMQAAPMNGHSNGASSNGSRRGSGSAAAPTAQEQPPQAGTVTESDAAADNADAALDFFAMDDDEEE